jgi:hypothetical protein
MAELGAEHYLVPAAFEHFGISGCNCPGQPGSLAGTPGGAAEIRNLSAAQFRMTSCALYR